MPYSNSSIRNNKKPKPKSRPRKRKPRYKNENSTIYIGIFSFILITIYLSGYIYVYLSKQPVAVETVQPGSIEVSNNYKGVVIRDEQVIKSTIEGAVTYYYSEGEKVKKDSIVCSVKDPAQTQVLQDQIKSKDDEINRIQSNRSEISLIQDSIDKRNKKIENIASNYMTGTLEDRLNNLYSFRNHLDSEITLRNQDLLLDNQGSAKSLIEERENINEQLKNSINEIISPTSGIISFSIDEFEDEYSIDKMESLRPEQTKMEIEAAKRISTNNIEADKAVFRVINSSEWYIAAYIPNSDLNGWNIGDSKTINTFINNESYSLNVKIKEIKEVMSTTDVPESLVIFYTNRNLLDFINIRSINFQIEKKAYEGLKVPNTAIVEKTFLKIPLSCIIDDSGTSTIKKVQGSDEIKLSVSPSSTDESNQYTYIIQDFNNIKIGDKILQNSDERKEYTIEEAVPMYGVYVVNTGTADLKPVQIIQKDKTHSIVAPIGQNSLIIYDRIISDVKSIEDGILIDNLINQ